MKNLALHWKILIGMVLGLVFGYLASQFGLQSFVNDFIKPIGTIFISLLKLIAIPLILASLIKGVADLKDISKFSKMGLRTIMIYVFTTVIAVTIGLIVVNVVQPGSFVSEETIANLTTSFGNDASSKVASAASAKSRGPLQFLVDMVPDNIFSAAGNNSNMLQVIFFAIFFGISLLLIDQKKSEPVLNFIDGVNEVIMKMVDLIMLIAPYAVFGLLAALVTETTNPELFAALGWYMLCVLLGLFIVLCFYMSLVYFVVGMSPFAFLQAIAPAQLLAFSTSSSAATLPVTMERLEEHVGVDKEVVSFVCPVGATINMDGTSLYQAVAAIFICEALKFDLSFGAQLSIIGTATLASIGSAAVPGAGMVMLVIVLESLSLPAESLGIGLALIFAVDRPLDMCRTVINVTGDCTVATVIAKHFGKLNPPKPKNWDDNYKTA
jgi:Na+/H+-dicarboxylate symporter